MPKITPIDTIQVDEQNVEVATLPDAIQSLVTVYEEWTQKEADVADELQMVRAAKETLGRQIIQSYRQYQAQLVQDAATNEVPAAPDPAPAPGEELKDNALNDAPEGTVAVTGDDAE